MYKSRWIGYEEGHEETDMIIESDGMTRYIPRWVEDFYIRIDIDAFRIGNRRGGVNIFWAAFIHPIRWRTLRSSIKGAYHILKARLKGNCDSFR